MIWRFRAGLRVAFALSLVATLAACSSTGGGSGITKIFSKPDKPDDIPADYFIKKGYCPPIRVRGGTGVYTTYERGKDADPTAVRYSASIGRTARECSPTGSGLAIKVAVAGRTVGGPKGAAGDVSLPIRVVITRADASVAYSQLYKIGVNLQPPDLGADFQQVFTPIDLPLAADERDVTIYVGFDEGKPG